MNKKLIKILACSACTLGIATSIPFMTTSCGSSMSDPEPFNEIALDASNFKIENNAIVGFVDGFDWKDHKTENTILIPRSVTAIYQYAFCINNYYISTLPENIKAVRFENGFAGFIDSGEGDKNGYSSFGITNIERLIIPSTLKSLQGNNFYKDKSLKYIVFEGYNKVPSDDLINFPNCLTGLNNKGYIVSKGGSIDSSQIKEWLASKRSSFKTWTPTQL